MQLSEFDYAGSYGFYILYTFVAALYGFIVPTATIILIIGFTIQYWVDKYKLFKRQSAPIDVNYDFGRMVFRVFEVSILLFAVGYCLWSLDIHYDKGVNFTILNLVSVGIALLYVGFVMFAPARIKGLAFRDFSAPDCLSYYDKKFPSTYRKFNPASIYLPPKTINPDKKDGKSKKVTKNVLFFNEEK